MDVLLGFVRHGWSSIESNVNGCRAGRRRWRPPACHAIRSALLGLEAAAVDLGAGAGGHIDPRIALAGGGHLPGAGIAGGLAVVLAGGRDAEALLVVGGCR